MKELPYVSEAKLAQFLPLARKRSKLSSQGLKFEITTPLLKIGVALPEQGVANDQKMRKLASIVEELEERALWYADEDVCPGDWIQFEARMNCLYPASGEPVLFFECPHADDRDHRPRLVLHGSARHLTGRVPPMAVTSRIVDHYMGTDNDSDGSHLSSLARFLSTFRSTSQDNPFEVSESLLRFRWPRTVGVELDCFGHVLAEIGVLDCTTAERVAGYARITTITNEYHVCATPLYIERI